MRLGLGRKQKVGGRGREGEKKEGGKKGGRIGRRKEDKKEGGREEGMCLTDHTIFISWRPSSEGLMQPASSCQPRQVETKRS